MNSGVGDNGTATASVDAANEEEEINEALERLVAAGPTDIDYFIAHVTANFLRTIKGTDEAGCRADPSICMDPPTMVSVTKTTVNGNRATVQATLADFGERRLFSFVKESGTWKVDRVR